MASSLEWTALVRQLKEKFPSSKFVQYLVQVSEYHLFVVWEEELIE